MNLHIVILYKILLIKVEYFCAITYFNFIISFTFFFIKYLLNFMFTYKFYFKYLFIKKLRY